MSILNKIIKKKEAPKKTLKKEKKSKDAKVKKAKIKTSVNTAAYKFLKKPLVTEKGTVLETQGKYLFEVSKNCSKEDVKRAVRQVYGVAVKAVNVLNVRGKKRGSRGRSGFTGDHKKVIVTLAPGESIQIHEGV